MGAPSHPGPRSEWNRGERPPAVSLTLTTGPKFDASRQDRPDDLPMHVGQTSINPIMSEREPFVVDPEEVQDRRVQVMTVGRIFDGPVRPLIARPVRDAPPDPSPGEPRRERER